MTKHMLYSSERKVLLRFNDTPQEFMFIALSAKAREMMLAEARTIHIEIVKQFAETAEAINTVYQLQDRELLIEALLQAEQELFSAKAALTLAGDEADFAARVTAKAETLKEQRRAELQETEKAQLVEKLVSMEINRRLQTAWACAVLDATLVRVLHDQDRQPLFATIDEMKEALPPELLEKLYEALMDFLNECGNAQVFLKPHIFRG